MRRHWRHLFFPNARQPGTHKHTHRDETSSIPFYTACKIYINMSVASLTDGQIVPGLLRFCRRLSKCPKGGGGINSALDGLAGITHIGWRWERKKMSTAHIRTSSFLISLLCVSHLIVYLISCACRFSFSPRCAEYQFLSPEINSTHPAEHLLPPPSLSLSLVTVQFPSTIPLSLSRQGQSRQSPWHFSKRKADCCCCCPTRVRALLQQLTMDRSAH